MAVPVAEPSVTVTVIFQLPADRLDIGTLKPWQVELLESAWTPALAEYDLPLGPLMVSEQVAPEVTVPMSVRM